MTQESRPNVQLAPGVVIGGDDFVLIAGPCAVESRDLCFEVAWRLKEITAALGVPFIFKASYDKANRTSAESFRGPGMDEGLAILAAVREEVGVPILTDVHEASHAAIAADAVDVIQIPAFLCRQTDLLIACAETGKAVNIKKGQFLAPEDMQYAVTKIRATGNDRVCLTERGTSFGYHNLVVDMRGLAIMRQFAPVIFDATHSVQTPGGQGGASGGRREFAPLLARAAAAVGVDGFFIETHPNPDRAQSDGPNMIPLDDIPHLLESLLATHRASFSYR